MFRSSFSGRRRLQTRPMIGAALLGCLICLTLTIFHGPRRVAVGEVSAVNVAQSNGQQEQRDAMPTLQGANAREYLEERGEYQSLMRAVTAARFGLKRYDRSPFGGEKSGYLGMSHVQNLNAWFDDEGVTIRPTLSEEQRAKGWRLGMKLKAYGYGAQLTDAPPIISHKVKNNRIEYERSNCRLPIADCRFESLIQPLSISRPVFPSTSSQLQISNRQSVITEWYENRAAGIEQGFTLNARPDRAEGEPLRLVVGLEGDLRARVKGDGSEIELLKKTGERVLSYGQLVAKDAVGRELPAHLETAAAGREIALVVEDSGAAYPIDIDPITATRESKFTVSPPQPSAEFGNAVAIDGNMAVVGAALEDVFGRPDLGEVSVFTRTNTSWSFTTFLNDSASTLGAGDRCGYSVAISTPVVAFGCPDSDRAFIVDVQQNRGREITAAGLASSAEYGGAVAISFNQLDGKYNVIVGAPADSSAGLTNTGAAYVLTLDSNLVVTKQQKINSISLAFAGRFGASVGAAFNDLVGAGFEEFVVGAPGSSPYAAFTNLDAGGNLTPAELFRPNATDSSPNDQFGQSVALSGNKIVVGAPLDDNAKGTDAGAAYVFLRNNNGKWSQQQKLTASDGTDQDQFGQSVAIQGNTIVVGSPYFGIKPFVTRGNGRAYLFTWNINSWNQQTVITANDGIEFDQFGISVGISGDTVISGAEHATVGDLTDAGAAYAYRLDCVPPAGSQALAGARASSLSICPGGRISITYDLNQGTGTGLRSWQWRKNGVNIPGETIGVYSINNASASDVGTYDVIISNSCGAEISTPFTLTLDTFNINPTSQNLGASGSIGIVNLTSTGTCPWGAQSNVSWINTIPAGGVVGLGNGTVNFKVDPNPTASQRTGTISIAGQTFTVTQDGAATAANFVQFSTANYSVVEDCTTVTITVNRSGDTSSAASVDYATSDVTASERKDYITALGRLNFAPGETTKSFAVLINEGYFVEGNETFNVTLSNPSGVSLGGPSIATVTIIDDPNEPASNAIDDPQIFACQHYHDFLNRQPDPAGLAFWTGNITSCGNDANCIETKRINVSAAFYLSIEFQQTGYLVERIYKAAYGNATGNSTFPSAHQLPVPVVRLNEFLFDTQKIGQGVIVGQSGWEQVLENNKQAFTAEFVQRPRFTTAFPTSMSPSQFVDALNTNAGSPLSQAERDQLVSDLSSGARTRAQVLRFVAEHPNLVNAEFNRAFVLMEFFGYLRRNPNDPQDSDYSGYDFWLTKLNQFNGNFQNAEMVKAFISSGEYRQRFGP